MLGRWKYSGRHSATDFQTIAGESHQNASPHFKPTDIYRHYLQRKVAFRQEIIDRYFEIHKESISIFSFDVKYSTFFTLKPFDISLTFEGQGSGLLGTRLDVVRHFEVRNRVQTKRLGALPPSGIIDLL